MTPSLRISNITVPPNRLRKLRPDKVDELAESIRERGLLHPITVRPLGRTVPRTVKRLHEWKGCRYKLVTGRHRLEAVKKLGLTEIVANIIKLDDDDARLFEIDENLIRNELSPAERAIHLAERKRLYEKAHPQTKHGGDRKSVQVLNNENLKSFAADTAEKTGKGRSSIAREVAREKIADIADVPGTSLDQADELDAP